MAVIWIIMKTFGKLESILHLFFSSTRKIKSVLYASALQTHHMVMEQREKLRP